AARAKLGAEKWGGLPGGASRLPEEAGDSPAGGEKGTAAVGARNTVSTRAGLPGVAPTPGGRWAYRRSRPRTTRHPPNAALPARTRAASGPAWSQTTLAAAAVGPLRPANGDGGARRIGAMSPSVPAGNAAIIVMPDPGARSVAEPPTPPRSTGRVSHGVVEP